MEVPKQMPGAQNFAALIRELHTELRQPGTPQRGIDRGRWRSLARELTANRLERDRDGYISVPEAPGLGVIVDQRAARRYLVDVQITVNHRYSQPQTKTVYESDVQQTFP